MKKKEFCKRPFFFKFHHRKNGAILRAPQWRALFRSLKFQCCVLWMLTSKCASRHKGMRYIHIFLNFQNWSGVNVLRVGYVASWLRTRRFIEHEFNHHSASNHWKKIAPFLPSFSRFCIFCHLLYSYFAFNWPVHFCLLSIQAARNLMVNFFLIFFFAKK